MEDIYRIREERSTWFKEARFGMFIHWGVYAIPARGEWVRSMEKMSLEDYQTYLDEFNPIHYNPKEWVKLAKEAGMKYAVLTAKHHDGFCLFDSAHTTYKSTNTPANRDLVKEFVDACRSEGLKVGLYYSLLDWQHPDYPAYGDRQHPMRENEEFKNKEHNFSRYVDYLHDQVEELVTGYGKIDILWFDFSYHEFKGEAWRATDLVRMIRKHQPDVLIDNRLGGDMHKSVPVQYAGDFAGPEQGVPYECIQNENGKPLPWEACITLNNSWGYCVNDQTYKSSKDVIRTLVNCVSKGGNLLFNVGPNAYGEIPKASQIVLKEVGAWLSVNGSSLYNCGASAFEKPEWGRFTQNGKFLYAHLLDPVIGHINLRGLKGKIKKIRCLADGSEVLLTDFWNAEVDTFDGPNDIFFNFGFPVQNTFALPDEVDTVIAIELI